MIGTRFPVHGRHLILNVILFHSFALIICFLFTIFQFFLIHSHGVYIFQKFSNSTKQSPLELLFETCKNIGHSLGLDEPLPNRKRMQLESKDEENGVSGRKKQNISPVSYRSKSPSRSTGPEERKLLKPIVNGSVRTTPDSSGSPRIHMENETSFDRPSQPLSSTLLNNSQNPYQNVLPQNAYLNKHFQPDGLSNYHGLLNSFSMPVPPLAESHQRLSCDCFLCLLLSMKPLLSDLITFSVQSKMNILPSHNVNTKLDLFSSSPPFTERQMPLGIEYCMYCGIHCPSIQILLHHIRHNHLV